MDIYIDIDGVLLTKERRVADNAEVLIDYITTCHDCYWLTTHCRVDTNKAMQYLSQYYPKSLLRKLEVIQPKFWNTLKTEGINFNRPFLWLDDYAMVAELEVLREYDTQDNLALVDLNTPFELSRVKQHIINASLKKHEN